MSSASDGRALIYLIILAAKSFDFHIGLEHPWNVRYRVSFLRVNLQVETTLSTDNGVVHMYDKGNNGIMFRKQQTAKQCLERYQQ